MMAACGGNNGVCDRQTLGKYRAMRWDDSKRDNEHFFFGPGSLLLFGAASFLYELMPGSSHTANEAVSCDEIAPQVKVTPANSYRP